ncbi:precorrin-2 C(20)-methyltransferase [Bartonella sp. HY406]|uniref:precorrin-2 C(20)-methyltransferase n=1 Tax=Bartonella sp. HY406 TaxID=2979331 RepID=UPI0021C74793|nr:precorrin-2 C(20)-methyltransferase [Bartonella sp. HY406]UXN04787.1 precorrin-2 C(20)-methyltransferase [Bartonella sp. HY406]
MMKKGKIYGVGVGPGDPELITIKGLRAIEGADIIAFHQAMGKKSNALTIAECWIKESQTLLPLTYPITTQAPPLNTSYDDILSKFYGDITTELESHLNQGKIITVLAEGDPLFYSSFMYIHDRLADKFETIIIPGITSISGASAALATPICYRNETFTVLSAVLDEEKLEEKLKEKSAFAIMKLGRNIDKIIKILKQLNLFDKALYIERATMKDQKIRPLTEVNSNCSPYFSLILIPGEAYSTTQYKGKNL